MIQAKVQETQVTRIQEDSEGSKMYTDNGANTLILGEGWDIFSKSDQTLVVEGYHHSLVKSQVPVVNAVTKIFLPSDQAVLL